MPGAGTQTTQSTGGRKTSENPKPETSGKARSEVSHTGGKGFAFSQAAPQQLVLSGGFPGALTS